MSVHIRLSRHGSRKFPFYRVVVTDTRNPRDGRFIETVGTFNPHVEPPLIDLNTSRIDFWRGRGAKPSATLDRLIKQQTAKSDAQA
jgi:small subunit ribosomal protein S16